MHTPDTRLLLKCFPCVCARARACVRAYVLTSVCVWNPQNPLQWHPAVRSSLSDGVCVFSLSVAILSADRHIIEQICRVVYLLGSKTNPTNQQQNIIPVTKCRFCVHFCKLPGIVGNARMAGTQGRYSTEAYTFTECIIFVSQSISHFSPTLRPNNFVRGLGIKTCSI